jgi:hypothetical protein
MKTLILAALWWAASSFSVNAEEPTAKAVEYEKQLRKAVAESTHYLIVKQVRGSSVGERYSLFGIREPIAEATKKELIGNKWTWMPEKKTREEGDSILIFLKDGSPTAAVKVPYASTPTGNAVFGLTFEAGARHIIVREQITDNGRRLTVPKLRKSFPKLFKP